MDQRQAIVIEVIKHLPRRHNQKAHGHSTGTNNERPFRKLNDFAQHGGRQTFKINKHTVSVDVSIDAPTTLLTNDKTKITLEHIAEAYSGGLNLISKNAKLSININVGTDYVQIDGRVFDKGTRVAVFEREFLKKQNKIAVEHGAFQVDEQYQGNGYGSALFFSSEEAYKKMGVDEISIAAGLTVGGYAWARMGFDFVHDYKIKDFQNKLHYRVDEHFFKENLKRLREQNLLNTHEYSPELKNAMSKAFSAIKKLKHPYQFAAFSIKIDDKIINVGKETMLGTNWSGVKYLKPGKRTPSFTAGEQFKRIKLVKKNWKSGASEDHYPIDDADDNEWMKQMWSDEPDLLIDVDVVETKSFWY